MAAGRPVQRGRSGHRRSLLCCAYLAVIVGLPQIACNHLLKRTTESPHRSTALRTASPVEETCLSRTASRTRRCVTRSPSLPHLRRSPGRAPPGRPSAPPRAGMPLPALLQALWDVPTSTLAYSMIGAGALTFGLLMAAPSLTAPYGEPYVCCLLHLALCRLPPTCASLLCLTRPAQSATPPGPRALLQGQGLGLLHSRKAGLGGERSACHVHAGYIRWRQSGRVQQGCCRGVGCIPRCQEQSD